MKYNIKKKYVKAIYFESFTCPECDTELEQDQVVLTTYPPQYPYYCPSCGFACVSSQAPGLRYEFEEEEDV